MCWSRLSLTTLTVFLLLVSPIALAQSPLFVTQTPITGNSGATFFVFLPVVNIGTGAATNMQLKSVALTHLGSSVSTVLEPAVLPFVTGSGYLGPGGVRKLDLEFANSTLVSGTLYIIKVSGTYAVNGTTYGFVLNRPVIYAAGFAAGHQQVLDAITAKFASRSRLDPNADNQMMLAFVKGLPQISAAGIGPTSSLVWAQFADTERKLVILNNKPLSAEPGTNSAAVPSSALTVDNGSATPNASTQSTSDPPTEIPASIKARLLNGLGSGISNPVPDIHSWLVDKQAYSDPIGASASVAGLRNVGGDGVLYISSHGGSDVNDGILYHIWTTTPTTDDCLSPSTVCPDPLLPGDILNGLVGEFTADNRYDPDTQEFTSESHYAINTEFVKTYWHDFGGNAFVFIDTCDSDKNDVNVQDFKNALLRRKVSVYAGWTGEVGSKTSAGTARLVFDRLVGANQFCPENGQPCALGEATPPSFAQRAFDYTQVAVDLPLHELGADSKLGGKLMFEYFVGSFGLLAPSISNMQVQELNGAGGQLTINGTFGQDPRPNGSVQVGGMDAPIESWEPNKIVVDLTLSGPGSAGDVVVKVRNHRSNVARLTEWKGQQFFYTISGNGSLQLTATFNLHFRLDIRKFRKQIHLAPDEPVGDSLAATDSRGTFSASGAGPGIDQTFEWSGSGDLIYTTPTIPITGLNIFAATLGIVDSTHLKNFVGAASEANAGGLCTVITPMAPPVQNILPVEGPGNLGPLIGTSGIWSFPFTLDADTAEILQNSASASGVAPVTAYFCMYDKSVATYNFKWGPVPATNDTAPDPKSAR